MTCWNECHTKTTRPTATIIEKIERDREIIWAKLIINLYHLTPLSTSICPSIKFVIFF